MIAIAAGADEPTIRIEEEIDVLALTPVSETGIDPERFPWSLFLIDSLTIEEGGPRGITQILERSVSGVHTNSVQNNPLQRDLLFRGFSTSPLLGSASGLSVWEDGVRVNEVFGDIVQWDLLPMLALDRMELMAGAGSWGRREAGAESGGAWGSWAAYGAGEIFEEDGWRDFSPSESRRLFGKLSYQRGSTAWDLGIGWADSLLVGNGTAPTELLEIERSEVFTYPDVTDNDLLFPRLRGQRKLGSEATLEGVVYYRRSDISTFNADALDLDDEGHDEEGAPDAANNRSHTDQLGYGANLQITLTEDLRSRPNLLGLGVSWDEGAAEFDSSSELAFLTEDRTTVGTGLFDPESFVAVDSHVLRSALYATDSLQLSRRTTLTAQLRYDSTSIRLVDRIGTELNGEHEYGRLNGGIGATASLRPDSARPLTAFVSASRSSRTPTPVELTCADPDDPCRLPNAFVADPPLHEVVTSGLEAGLRGRWSGGSWSTSYFDSKSRNDIVFVSSGRLTSAGHFTNVDSTRRRGLDVSLRGRNPRHSWFLGYTWVDASFGSALVLPSANHPLAIDGEIEVKAGATIPGIPRHIAKAGLSLRFGRWTTVASTTAQSSRYLRGDEANLLAPVAGFFKADAELSWAARSWIRVALSVDNLFDHEYETFGVLGDPQQVLGESFSNPRFLSPGAPRSVRLSLDLSPFDRSPK